MSLKLSRRLILTIITMGVATIVIGSSLYFLTKPPYPSEVTPLSFTGNGIKWTQNFEHNLSECSRIQVFIGDGINGANFSIASEIPSSENHSFQFADDSDSHGLGNLTLFLKVTDVNRDGLFDFGDSFAINLSTGHSFRSDTTYEISLSYGGPILSFKYDFYFAFHKGVFYSWGSHRMTTILSMN